MAPTKKDRYLAQLQTGDSRQKTQAAAVLAKLAPGEARALLSPMIAGAPDARARRTLVRCLHRVADAAAALDLSRGAPFEPELLPPAALAAVLVDLRASLAGETPKGAERRLRALGFLGKEPAPLLPSLTPGAEGPGREALLLLLDVIDDPRLEPLRSRASRDARRLGLDEGAAALLERWRRGVTAPLEALLCWMQLASHVDGLAGMHEEKAPPRGAVLGAAELRALAERATAEVRARRGDGSNGAPVDLAEEQALLEAAPFLPVDLSIALLLALLERPDLQALSGAVTESIVALGEPGVRAIFERAGTMGAAVVAAACAASSAAEAHDMLAPRLGDPAWSAAAARIPAALRDPRFVPLAEAMLESDPPSGFALLSAMAAPPGGASRGPAFAALVRAAARAATRLDKRRAMAALGHAGDPEATPILCAALVDPLMADSIPLLTTALGASGDARAIPALERIGGEYANFARHAAALLRSRLA